MKFLLICIFLYIFKLIERREHFTKNIFFLALNTWTHAVNFLFSKIYSSRPIFAALPLHTATRKIGNSNFELKLIWGRHLVNAAIPAKQQI